MLHVDLSRVELKPGIHLVLARRSSDAYLAIQQIMRAVHAEPTFAATMGGSGFSRDRERKVGYVTAFGDGQHYQDIEEMYEYLRTARDNASYAWLCQTMHPWAIDRIGLESMADAQRRLMFVRDVDPEKALAQTMTDPEAHLFWEAYKVGIQQLSEILITEGLW
jgi:hypothetical protein